MPRRTLTEPEGEATSGDERPGGPCAGPRGGDRGAGRGRPRPAPNDHVAERLGRRPERVEDRLVADRATSSPREPVGGCDEHRRDGLSVELGCLAGAESSLDERRAVERPGRATDRRHQPVPDGSQQLAGRSLGWQLSQKPLDRPEAGREVVAVIAVAEDCIEPSQIGGVPIDGAPNANQARPDHRGIDRPLGGKGRGRRLCGDGPRR